MLCCFYNPHKSNIANHLKNICKTLDKLSSTYENLILLGDFNAEPEEESIAEFLNLYNLKNLVKQNTCFKNPDKTTCIDLILTNCPRSFQNTETFETGLSDFHKLTFTVLKQKPRVVTHRQYKNFRNDYFRIELITDNKKFWKSVKPLFSDKITVKEIINLTENGEILTSNTDKADTFNDYFSSVVKKGYNEKIKIT